MCGAGQRCAYIEDEQRWCPICDSDLRGATQTSWLTHHCPAFFPHHRGDDAGDDLIRQQDDQEGQGDLQADVQGEDQGYGQGVVQIDDQGKEQGDHQDVVQGDGHGEEQGDHQDDSNSG